MKGYSIGIDIGGTSIKAAAFFGNADRDGLISGEIRRYPTRTADGAAPVREIIERAIDEISRGLPGRMIAIGVGTPGLVDREGNLIGAAVNIPGWDGLPLSRALEERWRVPVSVANDANMTAYGEWRFGAETGSAGDSLVCISLGTGIGGGVVLDGRILVGAGGMAGEIGHVVVEEGGRPCNCGLSGCLERYSSATGIAVSAVRMAPDFDSPLSREIAAGTAGPTAKQVYRALSAGDSLAAAIHRDSSRHLAKAIGVLAQTVNPKVIVIGGGVLEAGDIIIEGIREFLPRFVLPMSLESLNIRRASLGESAGVWGAAAHAWDKNA
jgi:glucokinase